MSDGVWKYCGRETLIRVGRECRGQDVVDELLRAARLPNGGLQDDFTLVVIEDVP